MELQPAERRRQRQRADARRAILDATEALLVEEGYDRFSMRKLAERCGYTAPTIYHYFADKRGLIDALVEERFRQLLTRLRRAQRGEDPRQNIRELALAFIRFALRNPTHYRLLNSPRPAGSEPAPSAEAARALVEQPFRQLAEQGRLLTDDVEAATQIGHALLHGLISHRITRPEVDWSPRLFDEAIEMMLRGFVRDPVRQKRQARS
jgi:AcrR family transcriptional regulator